MPEAEFFEEYGLFKKCYSLEKAEEPSFKLPPITMSCDKCGCKRTFIPDTSYGKPACENIGIWSEGFISKILYNCTACKDFKILFLIYSIFGSNNIMKIAQWPAWLPEIDKDLQKSLGKNLGNYKKGLYCEQEGYGIGAFAYYRRIVEDMIDSLLDDLYNMFSDDEKEKYKENIQGAKNEHVTEKKIEIIKDILPSHLRPGGINPLARLHSSLSEGLHSKPEDECLAIAADVRSSLEYLLNDLVFRKERNKNYIASMRKLEKQTSPRTIPNKK